MERRLVGPRRPAVAVALLLVGLAISPLAAAAAGPSLQPPAWDQNLRLPEAADHNPDPRVRRDRYHRTRRRGRGGAKHAGEGLDLRRRPARAAHPRQGRRPADRALHERPARAYDDPLARRAGPDRDGRRARHLAAGGQARRVVHLRLRAPRRRALSGTTRIVMSAAQVGFGLYGALLVEDPADGVGVADQAHAWS